ncbi:hypothetical protein MSAN_00815600 [Mycena sanguinolenta]|uniref:HCP-like protein n=1 Tax=Mycena sanguinolenta TaxID=230812 RepID=A0A8H7DDG3_9AGAR|nr:hypothetical protein MSAN_00815600 [Mycena sanguinolenta]
MAAAPIPDQQQFQFHHSSPLDTLVRKTSARKPSAATSAYHDARDERRWPQQGPSQTEFQRQAAYQGLPKLSTERQPFQSNSGDTIRQADVYPDDGGTGGAWAIPTVMVSAPEHMGYATTHAGKTPIIRPTTANFSRPARPAVEVPHAWENEQKKRVLERNASRRTAAQARRPDSSTSSVYSQNSALETSPQSGSRPQSRSPEPPRSPEYPQRERAPGEPVQLLRKPPSLRASSPVSLYSTYSYYQLDSATPSPTDKQFPSSPSTAAAPSPLKRVEFAPTPASPSSSGARTAQEFLQLGIQHHEADRLGESAACFERAATVDGGCGVGMLMWGLALRHGWGCTKNEKQGFKWLRRAAEHAVSDLESARQGGAIDDGAVQTELVLAIYEVGQCFFHGWGIPKDQKMGVSYYAVAARMGDADAQMDLGFCLANGKGTKKDRKEAAKWYRAAVAQGQSDVGLAWIYKEKLQ